MSITQDQVVSIHYTLKDDAGEIIDASAEGTPLTYLHGHGNLIPGLERELTGKNAGDRLQRANRPGAMAMASTTAGSCSACRAARCKGVPNVKVGMRLQTQGGRGPRAVTVTQVLGDMVTLDGNHPLAGKNLNFEVEVAAVRGATAEELAHGHVHGPGGHHH